MPAENAHPGIEPAEQAAAMLTAAGMARMPARVMMALVGSPDEGYTAADLSERLGVSAAAVSGAVRYLTSMRLIHRVSRPGDRRDRYDITGDAWHGMMTANAPLYANLAGFMDEIADENSGCSALGRARARGRRVPALSRRADAGARRRVASGARDRRAAASG